MDMTEKACTGAVFIFLVIQVHSKAILDKSYKGSIDEVSAATTSHGADDKPPISSDTTSHGADDKPPISSDTTAHGADDKPPISSDTTSHGADDKPPISSDTTSHGADDKPSISSDTTTHGADDKPSISSDTTAHDIIVAVNKAYNINLMEGDVQSLPQRYRNAVNDRSKLWPTTNIPYTMDVRYDAEEVASIQDALEEFHNKTCIRFVPWKDENDYIFFVQHKGCYSSVGRTGDQQEVTLEKPCLTRGTALHEIMHALGFWHEQNRSDRDAFIQIIWGNIEEGREFNFEKYSISDVDVLGAPYDYESIMHYSRTAFSKNGNPTITPIKSTTAKLGQRDHLSVVDAWKVNKLYDCFPTQTPATPRVPLRHPTSSVSSHKILTPPPLHPTVRGPLFVTPPPNLHHHRTPPPLHLTPHMYAWGPYSDWSPCDINCIGKRTRICLDFIKQDCGTGPSVQTNICPPPCLRAEYIGCWKNDVASPAIPMIENQRSETLQFHTLEAYRECADATLELGYPVFALFRDGDCLTGPEALMNFAKYGPSNLCGRSGQGSNAAIDVYTYLKHIDGNWGNWGEWESCSQPCGNGTRMRRRFCSNPPAIGYGEQCHGDREETKACNTDPCQDTDGSWSQWSQWTTCSRLCGVGIQNRKRKCDDPAPSGAGAQCPGFDTDTKHCIMKDCQQSQSCGNEAHFGTHGHINQGVYSKSMSCEYHVMTYTGTSVLLQVDRMDIETSPKCKADMLMIFDGNSTSAPLLATICGNIKHSPIRSSGNDLFILFESDSSIGGTGYTLSWQVTHSTYRMCPRPIEPIHGDMIGSSTYVGDSFRFNCQAGYHLIGPSVITCVGFDQYHAVWDNGFPRCDDSAQEMLPIIEVG